MCTIQVVVFCMAEQFKNPQVHQKVEQFLNMCLSQKIKNKGAHICISFNSHNVLEYCMIFHPHLQKDYKSRLSNTIPEYHFPNCVRANMHH